MGTKPVAEVFVHDTLRRVDATAVDETQRPGWFASWEGVPNFLAKRGSFLGSFGCAHMDSSSRPLVWGPFQGSGGLRDSAGTPPGLRANWTVLRCYMCLYIDVLIALLKKLAV